MEENIKNVIKFLTENGYMVIKLTPQMQKDYKECEESDGTKECLGCSCSVCIAQ